MSKEPNVVLKTLKLSSKTVFLINDSLVVFHRKIKRFIKLDYMLCYKTNFEISNYIKTSCKDLGSDSMLGYFGIWPQSTLK